MQFKRDELSPVFLEPRVGSGTVNAIRNCLGLLEKEALEIGRPDLAHLIAVAALAAAEADLQ